ncbi:cholesterol 24-hydroxylase-like [Dendronephthya gigantea]|uniref:cholesterol 24-hydroxylase-like n=1 Tax=Dendronephthya gigantea TaxID=151771 RepID=UPI00106B2E44|nr:cholesterol 24-hydroxylase-like [Dendronephthya gigantea]
MGFIFGERGGGYGLITNTEESSHHRRRQIMNPAFHRKCLKDFMSKFNYVCDRFLVRMDTIVHDRQPTSMVKEFANVTLEVASQAFFNIETHAIEIPNSPFPAAMQNYLRGIQHNFDIPLHPVFLTIFQFKIFQNATKRLQIDAVRFLRKFAFNVITTRMKDIRQDKVVPEDLLSLLINDGSLSMDDIIDEFITIFIAGQDTTANALSFALYGIITNPHVEDKLLNELDQVLGDRDHVEFADLVKLKYLDSVFEESLRKYPVVQAPSRILTKDITVGGYHIPKGNGINSLQILFCMNPEIWKNPEVFDPERFSNAKNMRNFGMTHFPFSIGPRNCIGYNFARIESKVILARLLRKFKFKLMPGQSDKMRARVICSSRDGVICHVTER